MEVCKFKPKHTQNKQSCVFGDKTTFLSVFLSEYVESTRVRELNREQTNRILCGILSLSL